MSEDYSVCFEIAGPAAMFARPDTGSTPISYPVPTCSAAKGMFDAVLWRPHDVYIRPTRVEICGPVRFERYVTNYGGPLRSSRQIDGNNNYQLVATILVDVCYCIYGEVRPKWSTRGRSRPGVLRSPGRNALARAAEFKHLFDERLKNRQTFYAPCLGWREFVPTYFGAVRSQRDCSVNITIPSLLHSMWEHRQLKPDFRQDWEIVNGIMSYEHRIPLEVCNA